MVLFTDAMGTRRTANGNVSNMVHLFYILIAKQTDASVTMLFAC
jgi:hypothetical protein